MLLDRAEAVAFAAVLQSLRDGSATPIVRPGISEPTFFSRPIVETSLFSLAPTTTWTEVLSWTAPKQFISSINAYAVSTKEPLVSPRVDFRLLVDGALPPGVDLGTDVDLCKDPTQPWPLARRETNIFINELGRFSIEARNPGVMPKLVLAAAWGWSYPTTEIEFGRRQGIVDV